MIDLVSKILKCSIKEALAFLSDTTLVVQKQPQHDFNREQDEIKVIKTQEITHPALTKYLKTRNISLAIAKMYCKEVWYSYKGRYYFAIGLKNDLGGWELRNKMFKNSSSPKSYTLLNRGNNQLIILEGMFDLLSLAVLNDNQTKTSDILVLNSTAFIKDAELQIANYENVYLYLDNDANGRRISDNLVGKRSQQAAERMQFTTVKQVQYEKEFNQKEIRAEIKRRYDLAMKQFRSKSLDDYLKAMEANRVNVIPSINKQNKLQGFRFEFDGHNLKGSEVHQQMSLGNIGKQINAINGKSILKENTVSVQLPGKVVDITPNMH